MKLHVLFSLCVGLFGIPAQADEVIKMPHLPQNVKDHYNISPYQIQILPPGPDINDLRNQQQNNHLTIVIGPNQTPTTISNVLTVPGNNVVPSSTSLGRGRLPDANFCSHIQPNNHPLGILPSGQSTNGLRNMFKPTPVPKATATSPIPVGKSSAQQIRTNTILKYTGQQNPAMQNTTGSNQSKVETEVKGIVKPKRGDLLHSK